MKITRSVNGNKTLIDIISEHPDPKKFSDAVTELRLLLSATAQPLTLAETSKLFGYNGTTQDGRNFGRKLNGTRAITFAEYELALALIGRVKAALIDHEEVITTE